MLATLSGCAFVRYKNKIASTKINAVKLETVKNGKYEGFYDVEYINAKVLVTVDNHKITDIELIEHKYGHLSGEPMVQKVLDSQSLEVDAISGATNSCKTVLKAIETALRKGQM
jgi:uncharacterized protein with FMN-binding domain